jgi:hypothetical protein
MAEKVKRRIIAEIVVFIVLFVSATEAFGRVMGKSVILEEVINSLNKVMNFLWERGETVIWATVGVLIAVVASLVAEKLIRDWELWQLFKERRI